MWLYQGKPFTTADIGQNVGFVYLITDSVTGKKYIGKKLFFSTRKIPPLKGKSRKRTKVTESDWQDYYSSSDTIKALVAEHGKERFKREILHLCRTKSECTYYESKLQFENDVLFSDDWHNDMIMCRLSGSHFRH